MSDPHRKLLLLQQHPSTFAKALADALARRGAEVVRVTVSLGDWLSWAPRPARAYRGRLGGFSHYVRQLILEEHVTALVVCGDRCPYNRIGIAVMRDLGRDVFVYENGYLRPDWITLERFGMVGFSHFPNDPARIRALAAAGLPRVDERLRYPHRFFTEAWIDVLHTLSQTFCPVFYPFYDSGRIDHPLADYLHHLAKLLGGALAPPPERALAHIVDRHPRGWFVVPLQVQGDYQIRDSGRYASIGDFIREVVASFARHAPEEVGLVFREHPLDSRIRDWGRSVRTAAAAAGVSERVFMTAGGPLAPQLDGAAGVVTINSSAGLEALSRGLAVKTMGAAIYDVAGLTFQGRLDDFWRAPTAPDPSLLEDFLRLLAASIQVKGDFYHPEGRRAAAEEMADRIVSGRVNGYGAFCAHPPRLQALEDARAQPASAAPRPASPTDSGLRADAGPGERGVVAPSAR